MARHRRDTDIRHIGKCGATLASITTDITMPIMPPLILLARQRYPR